VTPTLRLRAIRKNFGVLRALDGVDLTVAPGTTHALLGENGAGKSTLMHVIAGLLRPDDGTMEIDGIPNLPRDPAAARRLGIGLVHQHFTSVPALTVWENFALAAGWPIRGARGRTAALLEERGISLDPDARAGELTVGLRQQLELQKALATRPRLLLLDEPTGVLAPPEVVELFRVIGEFKARGGTVVLITHKLDEAVAHADGVTVLRRGQVTGEWGTGARPTQDDLIQAMLGADQAPGRKPQASGRAGAVVATVGELEIRAGEVLGVAGVEGNGQRELLRSIPTTAFIPEDRTTEGLIAEFTLTENFALAPILKDRPFDWEALRTRMAALIGAFGIKASGPDAVASSLSGGNQQKVVVARALEGGARVIVAENPARGLDVGAAREVFRRLREAATEGAAVVFHSTDLDEVLEEADRVVVMNSGKVIIPPPGADRDTIGTLMVSGTPQ
jgi:general nucleoside transport system ATP-binding protein